MKTVLPRETDARRKDTQIPSGKTRGKPKSAAQVIAKILKSPRIAGHVKSRARRKEVNDILLQ